MLICRSVRKGQEGSEIRNAYKRHPPLTVRVGVRVRAVMLTILSAASAIISRKMCGNADLHVYSCELMQISLVRYIEPVSRLARLGLSNVFSVVDIVDAEADDG